MKKLILFAMLIIATTVAFAAQEKSNEPQKFNLKTEIVDAAEAAPVNEVVKSIDYLVEKYSTAIVDNSTTKVIAKEAVQKQVKQAQQILTWYTIGILFLWLITLLLLLPYNFWEKRNIEEFSQVTGCALLILAIICTTILVAYIPDLITQLHNPSYYAFKEITTLFLQ